MFIIISFMICFGALIYERILLKFTPNRKETIYMVIADIIYVIIGIALLVGGIYRVTKFVLSQFFLFILKKVITPSGYFRGNGI